MPDADHPPLPETPADLRPYLLWLVESIRAKNAAPDEAEPRPALRLIEGGGESGPGPEPPLPKTKAELRTYCAWLTSVIAERSDEA